DAGIGQVWAQQWEQVKLSMREAAGADVAISPVAWREGADLPSSQTRPWRRQSRANPSLNNSLVTGKNTGNLSRITTRALSSSSDIKDLKDEFPSEQAGKF